MRTKRSFINITVNICGQALNFLLAILSRAVLARALPGEYLGINGLFSNVLNILSLAELGIGTAMVYALYKPVAEDDREEILKLINLYRRLYQMIAAAVAALGLCLIPFLGVLVKDGSQIEGLTLMYLLYLVQSVSSYLFVYKTSLITVNQKQYICNLCIYACTVIRYILQILVLIWTKNFFIYLSVQIFFTILPNILLSFKSERMYPYIKGDKSLYPDDKTRKKIFRNVRAMFNHKLGSVLVYNTDNLIMSAFVGLQSVGLYSNYKLISSNLNTLLVQVFVGTAASIGNLAATEEKKKVYEIFNVLDFLCFLLYGYCTVMMWALFKPFIRLFFGDGFLLSNWVVILLLAEFYITGMRQAMQQFRNAMGTFWYDRYKPIAEVILNLVISLLLVKSYGIAGILAGTVISLLLVPFWVEPYVFFKYSIVDEFKYHMYVYFRRYAVRALLILFLSICAELLLGLLAIQSILGLIFGGFMLTIFYTLAIFLLFYRSSEFQLLYTLFKNVISKRQT